MSKLFIQNLPSKEEHQMAVERIHQGIDSGALYSNLLFMKVATDLENYLDSFLAPYNLSAGRFTILYLLSDSPEGMIPSELSQKVGVTQATISGLINGLEKAELVKRELHQKDGRSFVIKLSDKGETLIRQIFPLWSPKIVAFWNQFSTEEKSGLNGLLEKMVKNTTILA